MQYKYRNISGQKISVTNLGEVDIDQIVTSPIAIENPNLQALHTSETMVGVNPVTKPKRN